MTPQERAFIERQAGLLMQLRGAGNAVARAAAARPRGTYKAKRKAQAAAKPDKGISAATASRANAFLDREGLLDRAVHAGVINDGMRGYYAQAFDADERGCRAFLASLGLRDAAAPGPSGGSFLTPQEQERAAAASDGKRRIVNLG
jgi:hypothetical protein